MRRFWVLCCLIVAWLPSFAAKRATVEQLEQTLVAARAAHKADGDTARQIGVLEPSERISDATLNRLTKQFATGPRSIVALQLLADKSSFLDLPARELPALTPPDEAQRRQQFEA